jgi:hypothetical protein
MTRTIFLVPLEEIPMRMGDDTGCVEAHRDVHDGAIGN